MANPPEEFHVPERYRWNPFHYLKNLAGILFASTCTSLIIWCMTRQIIIVPIIISNILMQIFAMVAIWLATRANKLKRRD